MDVYIREAPIARRIHVVNGLLRTDLSIIGTFLLRMIENIRLEGHRRI